MKNIGKKSRDADDILLRNVVDIIEKNHLGARLKKGDRLRVKFGIDPTAPDLHLGHAVLLRALKRFQDAGHTIVLIIGDFTGMIGDPSGRSDTRPLLTSADVQRNRGEYLEQASLILDIKKCEIRYNSEWYGKKDFFNFFFTLASYATIQQVLERDDFQKRIRDGIEISILEALYPLLQGYDSVEVRADVEIGGTDQKFNLLMGRKLQRRFGFPEQDIITFELLLGTDGVRKMSKSFGNTINFTDSPRDMFGKIMSIRDNAIIDWYKKTTDMPLDDIQALEKKINSGSKPLIEVKKDLAYEVTSLYHSAPKAKEAKEYFEQTFQKRELPKDAQLIFAHTLSDNLILKAIHISKSELRRLVGKGAVEFEGKKIDAVLFIFPSDGILRVGKKKFFKIKKE